MATAPARVNTSGARLYDVSEWTTSWPRYCSNARCSSSASGETERVSFTIGRSQSMKSAAGTNSAPSASAPVAEVLPLPQRTNGEEADERDPEEDRIGRMDDGERQARGSGRGDEPDATARARDSSASASAAGTRS